MVWKVAQVNLAQQWQTVLYMLITGGVLGLMFDIARASQKQIPAFRRLLWLMDVMYWLLAAWVMFYFLFHSNEGQFRIYIFLFVLLGGWLYFRLLSTRVIKIMIFLIYLLQTLVRWLFAPLYWMFRAGRFIACTIKNKFKANK